MDPDSLRAFCLSFPNATEDIQWGSDLLFRIGGKIFAAVNLDQHSVSFKCSPEKFAELTEKDGIVPAPYVARYYWVMLERLDALPASEIKKLICESHRMIFEKLPRKAKARLNQK